MTQPGLPCLAGRERCYRVQWEKLQEAEQAKAGAEAEAGEEASKEAGFRKDATPYQRALQVSLAPPSLDSRAHFTVTEICLHRE